MPISASKHTVQNVDERITPCLPATADSTSAPGTSIPGWGSRLRGDPLFYPSSPKHQVVLVDCNHLSRRDGRLGCIEENSGLLVGKGFHSGGNSQVPGTDLGQAGNLPGGFGPLPVESGGLEAGSFQGFAVADCDRAGERFDLHHVTG